MAKKRPRQKALEKQVRLRIDEQHHRYADNWSRHSDHNEKHGHYEWNATFVSGRQRILEIGAGDGRSTAILCKHGAIVVSIDSNPQCIRRAEATLKSTQIPVQSEFRGSIELIDKGFFTNYSKIKAELDGQGAYLIEGDILPDDDPHLTEWLQSIQRFDAVVCWSIGTHAGRYKAIEGGPEMYRLLVRNYVYEIADKILASGGILHFIDRGPAQVDQGFDIATEILASHQDQASVTSLVVDAASMQSRTYIPPDIDTGISVGYLNGQGNLDRNFPMVLQSIIARKP